MKGKAAGLFLLAVVELVGGLGAKSEAMACRARAEVYRRCALDRESRVQEYTALLEAFVSPTALAERQSWRRFLEETRTPVL